MAESSARVLKVVEEKKPKLKTHEIDGIHFIKCSSVMDHYPSLDDEMKEWCESPAMIHIVDLAEVRDFKKRAYRTFVLFHAALKAKSKRLFGMSASVELVKQLNEDGLSGILTMVKDKQEALAKSKPQGAKGSIDAEFVSPFITGTVTVLQTQCNMPVTPGKPRLKTESETSNIQIAGVISLSNPAFTGTISLCFPAVVFLKLYENMVGEIHKEITSETEDGAGEILNMIFGAAKTILNDQRGFTLDRALPTILSGEKLKLRQSGRGSTIVIPFETTAGAFHIEIMVEKT